jgi:hypothetical protein
LEATNILVPSADDATAWKSTLPLGALACSIHEPPPSLDVAMNWTPASFPTVTSLRPLADDAMPV